MKFRSFILCLIGLVGFGGCSYFTPTYEEFVKSYADFQVGNSFVPKEHKIDNRKIYDKNRYIYISEYPKGCVVGFLTNRDDKPEVVQDWIILSGKEFCKLKRKFYLFLG